MAPRATKFNKKWTELYSWLSSVDDDSSKAYCKLCKKTFSIASKGEGAVKEHADGTKHKDAEKSTKMAQSLQRFFVRE